MVRLNLSPLVVFATAIASAAFAAGASSAQPVASTAAPPELRLVARGPMQQLDSGAGESAQWTSSDPSVVTVSYGWAFGQQPGTAVITETRAGRSTTFTVRVTPGAALAVAPTQPEPLAHFITRRGNQLFDGDRPFRFISWNVPNLHIVEDPSWKQLAANPGGRTPDFWHRVSAAEQEDAIRTVAEMGGQVIRVYTLSIAGGRNNAHGPSHYTGPDDPPNEALMRDYDRMIALCGKHGVRLMLPFIDEWDWFGGRKEFAALNGGGDFYRDRRVIEAFKALIATVVNRVNSVTGIAYKDDPTIMAWETGNELQHVPPEWTREIAAWIKLQAPRQLVSDGGNGLDSLDDPAIDLVTSHYYAHGGKDYVGRLVRDVAQKGAKKPFFIGEFGCTDPEVERATFDAAERLGIAGALLWSLRFHAADGGFYWHDEGSTNSAYHWPGFASNARSDERAVLAHMRQVSWAVRGYLPPPPAVPDAPVLLPDSTSDAIAWCGSTGAEHYTLERSADGSAWTRVAADLTDAGEPFQPYRDTTAPAGGARYRLQAVNAAGASPWSEPVQLSARGTAAISVAGNDPRISIEGRSEWDGHALQIAYPGVTLRCVYRGPAPALRITASNDDCYFNLSVNHWDPVVIRLKKGENQITPPSGAAPASGWVIELARRTEAWMGTVAFEGLEIPVGGELLPAPQLPERKILVIGDSTTAGEYIDRFPPEYIATPRATNAPRCYAMLLGRWLHAQTHLVAYGGQGLLRDWAGKPTDIVLPKIYSRALPDKIDSYWDPRRYQADLVLVNVGTDTDAGPVPDDVFLKAYSGFVARIRADYPHAAIVLCQNSHQHPDAPARAQLLRTLEAVKARQEQAGDRRVFVARASFYPGTPNDPHIVAFQQEELAEEILPVVKAATGW